MQRAIWTFIAGTVIAVAVIVGAGVALMQQDNPAGGFIIILAAIVPLAMAYVAHRVSGASGNPFKGLSWGPTSWFFLAWLGGLAVGIVAAALALGLGLGQFDPEMTDYVAMAMKQAEEQSGSAMPKEAASGIRIAGLVTAIAGPTIGAWFLAAIVCLGTFPWLGFLYRRLMVAGRAQALLTLAAVWLVVSASGGAVDNPMTADIPLGVRLLLNGLMGAALAPASVWLFLRTSSAVIPALAQASYQGLLSAAMVMTSDSDPLLGVPGGALAIAAPLLAGIALWTWNDPGGEHLAVAAVASDGTPLTPQQVAALQSMPPPVATEPQQEPVASL